MPSLVPGDHATGLSSAAAPGGPAWIGTLCGALRLGYGLLMPPRLARRPDRRHGQAGQERAGLGIGQLPEASAGLILIP